MSASTGAHQDSRRGMIGALHRQSMKLVSRFFRGLHRDHSAKPLPDGKIVRKSPI